MEVQKHINGNLVGGGQNALSHAWPLIVEHLPTGEHGIESLQQEGGDLSFYVSCCYFLSKDPQALGVSSLPPTPSNKEITYQAHLLGDCENRKKYAA